MEDKESSGSDTEDRDTEVSDSCGKVREMVCRSSESVVKEPRVTLKIRSRGGEKNQTVNWLLD